jgi:hypothetical protein
VNAVPGIQTQIRLQLADGKVNQFPRAFVYDGAGSLDDTIDLTHIADGLYSGDWTPTNTGEHCASIIVYKNGSYTQVNKAYDQVCEPISVHTASLSDITIVKALLHDNSVVDQQTYSQYGDRWLLTGTRVRGYDTKANAQAAGATGLLFTFTVTATYDVDGKATGMTVVREGS